MSQQTRLNTVHAKASNERDLQKSFSTAIDVMVNWATMNLATPLVFIVKDLLNKAKIETNKSIVEAGDVASKTANINAAPSLPANKIQFKAPMAATPTQGHNANLKKSPSMPVLGLENHTKGSVKAERLEKAVAKGDKINFRLGKDMALKPTGNMAKSDIEQAQSTVANEDKQPGKIVFMNGKKVIFKPNGQVVADNSTTAPSAMTPSARPAA